MTEEIELPLLNEVVDDVDGEVDDSIIDESIDDEQQHQQHYFYLLSTRNPPARTRDCYLTPIATLFRCNQYPCRDVDIKVKLSL